MNRSGQKAIQRFVILVAILPLAISIARGPCARPATAAPLSLENGPHLLLDDHFIARSEGIERAVISPRRFLADPVVTSAEKHQNWQPFLTVRHDPSLSMPFRMWYNADTVADPTDGAWFGATAYLESEDGIRWPGPYERLISLKAGGAERFGASVLDEGPRHLPAAERFKMMYFDPGPKPGPRVAFSSTGIIWTPHDGGKPVIGVKHGEDIWSAGFDPMRRRYFLIGKMEGPVSWTNAEGRKVTANIRRCGIAFSDDFKIWSEPKQLFAPDEKDAGITQWYGADGFLVRGDLRIAFLRVLRDDLSPAGVPPAAVAANAGSKAERRENVGIEKGSGMGYTVLAWTRDGENWHRDRHTDKFFEPDPRAGTWDHAMAWIGSSVLVGGEVYLYYSGYRWGHKHQRSVERQLGLVKAQRDRFVARRAGEKGGSLVTHPVIMRGDVLSLNVDAKEGEVRVQISTASGEPIPGFRFAECEPVASDSLAAPVRWKESLSKLRGRAVRLEFSLRCASLFAFDVH